MKISEELYKKAYEEEMKKQQGAAGQAPNDNAAGGNATGTNGNAATGDVVDGDFKEV